MHRVNILNVPVDICSTKKFISKINEEFKKKRLKTIMAINPEKIIMSKKDSDLLLALKKSDFLLPDGIGIVLGIRFIHNKKILRTTGIMMMEHLLNLADKNKLNIFVFGAKPEINIIASKNIIKKYSNLNLVGTQHGYIPEGGYNLLVKKINSLKTDILFVGLGSPKQEKWIHQYRDKLKVKLCIGVGGSLDVIAGKIKRAPIWIQNIGLEWLYRLIKQPFRLPRYKALVLFVLLLVKEKINVHCNGKSN